MKVLAYTVKGDPRTKKNHQTIAGAGKRCPVCKKFQKQWIRQGAAHDQFVAEALWQLKPRPKQPIEFPINVRYLFFMQTRRIVDATNLMEAMDDILIAAGIIKDDNSRIIIGHDGTRVLYDHDNPRTEIYITRVAPDGQLAIY